MQQNIVREDRRKICMCLSVYTKSSSLTLRLKVTPPKYKISRISVNKIGTFITEKLI